MAYMGEGRHREQPAWTSIGCRSLLPPLAARATTEKERFDGGDGVEEASNAVAAIEARERHTAGAILHGPWPN